MFIAKVPFEYQDKNGSQVFAKSGDEVPCFNEWPRAIKKAHIELDWVVEVELEKKPIEVIQHKGRTSKK